jgi:hypothetical protein
MSDITFYLHIGLPKTGTTSLQHFLKRNQKALLAQGCLYPSTGLTEYDNHAYVRFLATDYTYWAFYVIFKTIRYTDWYVRRHNITGFRDELFREIDKSHARSVVLSSEWFGVLMTQRSLRRLQRIFHPHRVIPVIYLRRQDALALSLYAEWVKDVSIRLSKDFNATFMKRLPFLDFYAIYRRWARTFGRENIIIRTYENLVAGDVIHDFLSLLDLDPKPLTFPTKEKNPHLDTNAIVILRDANRQRLPDAEFQRIKSSLQAKGGKGALDFMSVEEKNRFASRFDDSNTRLAQEYYGRTDLFG